MSFCSIKEGIQNKATEVLIENGAFVKENAGYFSDINKGHQVINSINKEFKGIVVKEGEKGSFFIEPSDQLVQEYLDVSNRIATRLAAKSVEERETNLGITPEGDSIPLEAKPKEDSEKRMLQIAGTEAGMTESPEVIRKVKEFIKRIGVDVEAVKAIVVDGVKTTDNGLASMARKVIEYVNGKEGALTEEAMHFVVEILEQTNPQLFNEMFKEIGKDPIYISTLNTYGKNALYQDAQGKPNIRKIKKEAMAKRLANMLVEKLEADESLSQKNKWAQWLHRIKTALKELFAKAEYNPFEETVKKVKKGEIADASVITSSDVYLQQGNERQNQIYDAIRNGNITPSKDGYLDASNNPIPKRVTGEVSEVIYKKLFKDGDLNQDDFQKAMNELSKEAGTAVHADMQAAASFMFDENGFLLPEMLDDSNYVPLTSVKMYDVLKQYLWERVSDEKMFPKNTRFIIEKPVFNGKDLAGTIDFLAVTPQGKVQILDWKTMNLNTDKYTDVAWYKKKAWRMQINLYQKILEEGYGVKPSEFGVGMAIPIKVKFNVQQDFDGTSTPYLGSLQIGESDFKAETRDYLLPVAVEKQSTGDKKLDALLKKFTGLRETMEGQKATTTQDKMLKAEQLNALEKAVRYLQVSQSIEPMLDQADVYTKELQTLFEQYENAISKLDFSDEKNYKTLSDFGIKLNRAFDIIKIYTNLDEETTSIFSGGLSEEQEKELDERITQIVKRARKVDSKLEDVTNDFAEKVANSEGYENILSPEVQVGLNKKLFNETSKIQMVTLQTFYQKRREAQNRMDVKTDEENNELLKISEEYETLAKSKGWSYKDYFNILVEGDSNVLIDEFNPQFYKDLKKALDNKDYDWLAENIDLEAYKENLTRKYETTVEYLENKQYPGNPEEQQRAKKKALAQAKKEFDVSEEKSDGWFLHYHTIKQTPIKEKWESEKFKELKKPENAAAKKLYDWCLKVNEKADDAGYLPEGVAKRNFLPFVEKSLSEKLTYGGDTSFGKSFIEALTIDEETVGYGEIDKVNNRLVNKIPRPYLRKGDREVSTNLFKNLALYNKSVNRYQQLSQLEGIALALGRVERNKESIITSFWNKPKYNVQENRFETTKSEANANLYDAQIATLLYGQKYVQSEQFDQLLNIDWISKTFEKFNKFVGRDILPTNLNGKQLSLNKSVDFLNNYFQLKTLGLNPLSAISNALGGNFQAIISAGTYFNKKDFVKSEWELMSNALQGEEGKKRMAAIKYFMPFLDNETDRQLLKDLSLLKLEDDAIQEFLFSLMRKGDYIIQGSLFLANLKNLIIIDGQIVNARQYLRERPEWKVRYNNGTVKQMEEAFDKEVEALIEKNSLLKQSEIVDNQLVIPGFNRMSKDVFKVRNLSKELSTKAIGSISPEQVRGVQQNVYLRSMMVFKHWIPSLVDVRLGQMKFNAATDAYEWGRTRTVIRLLSWNLLSSIKKMSDVVKANENGIKSLKELYELKKADYRAKTGREDFMSEDEFYDLVRKNIRESAKDVLIAIALVSMYLLAKANPPDDDEDEKVRNIYKFTVKALDKVSDEVTFFYNPTSVQQILNGSIFPSFGFLSDGANVIEHFTKEVWGFSFDEELQEKNHTIKYVLKSFPITAQISNYLPLFAPELAKDLGIRATTESRRR